MDLLMNGLLLAATCFAGAYCWVLARRVRDLKSLDSGLGGAIVTLTRQVELARSTLEEARSASRDTKLELSRMVQQAEAAANQLRLLIAAAPPAAPARPASAPAGSADASGPARREPPPAAEAPEARAPAAPQIRLAPRPKAMAQGPGAERAPAATAIAIPTLDRLIAGPLGRPGVQEAEPARAAPHLAEVPKPRALAPVENPFRRIRPAAAQPLPADAPAPAAPSRDSEDAILEALSALAGSR